MFIERIDVTGFSGLRRWEASFGRAVRVDGPARALVALGDAIQLAFAAWDHDALRALLTRWGCREVKVEEPKTTLPPPVQTKINGKPAKKAGATAPPGGRKP